MNGSSVSLQLSSSVLSRPAPMQDSRTRYMEPVMDVGGPRTVSATRPGTPAVQPASLPMAGDPGDHSQSAGPHPPQADPQWPTAEPQSVEASAGTAAEAVPIPLDPPTGKSWQADWIGWMLVVTAVAITVAVSYATLGLVPAVISTAVPLVVVGTGIVVLLLVLTTTAIRRRLCLAVWQGRSQVQEEA